MDDLRSRRVTLVAAIAGLLGLLILVRGWTDPLPYWHYTFFAHRAGLLQLAWFAGLAVPVGLLARAALRLARGGRRGASIALVVAASVLLQLGTGLAGNGTAWGLWRWLVLGHGDFVRVALARTDLVDTARRYEELVAPGGAGALGVFAPAKPPGNLVFYGVTTRLARMEPVKTVLSPIARQARGAVPNWPDVAAFATVVWTLLAACGAIPMFFLGRRIGGSDEAGAIAAMLYASVPSVNGFLFHIDTVVLTPLAACMFLGAVAAADRASPRRRLAAVLTGVAAAISAYVSTGALPPFALAGLTACLTPLLASDVPFRERLVDAIRNAAGVLAGFLATTGLLALALGFHPVAAWTRANAYAMQWQAGTPQPLWKLLSAFEFTLVTGFGLCVLALAAMPVVRRENRAAFVLGTASLALFAGLCLFRGSCEMARLWMFFVPAMCGIAAAQARGAFPVVLALQVATGLAFAPWGLR